MAHLLNCRFILAPAHAAVGLILLACFFTYACPRACAGQTNGCFQIESQGQIHLLAKHQPESFGNLITEIALFRPGPLQGGMVRPFVRRRQGIEPVTYDHPDLRPILEDTYGVILFQE